MNRYSLRAFQFRGEWAEIAAGLFSLYKDVISPHECSTDHVDPFKSVLEIDQMHSFVFLKMSCIAIQNVPCKLY